MRKLNIAFVILQKLRVTWRLRKLEVASVGMEKDVPFVELANGLRFFGLAPGKKDKKYHRILPRSTRQKIPFTHYHVALDIMIRYVEGGLKLGGPRKERYYGVRPGDVVAEMGAYMGYYTLYLAQQVGSKGRVIAIEPMEDNLKYLRMNIKYNGFEQVEIVNKGVWKTNDTLSFTRNAGDTQSASLKLQDGREEEFTMEVRTLDHILENCRVSNVDYMVIQLNGVELEALEGLQNLRPDHLAIAARYRVERIDPVSAIKELLQKRGYRVKIRSRKYIYGKRIA